MRQPGPKSIFLIAAALFAALMPFIARAQSNQTVKNGDKTTAVTFNQACNYTWTNSDPSIGLPASGSGNIASFTAVNTGVTPVVATITATPNPLHYAYVANAGSGNVSVVNTETNTWVKDIPVQTGPLAVLVSPTNKRVYVTNQTDNSVSVINTATNTVITNVQVGDTPEGMCLSKDNTILYVAGMVSNDITEVSTATNTVIGHITGFDPADQPDNMCLGKDGKTMYVTAQGSGSVVVVDLASGTITKHIATGLDDGSICLSTDGSKLYVSDYYDKNIGVINIATSTVTYINLPNYPEQIVASPDGAKLYVADIFDNEILVVNTQTNSIFGSYALGAAEPYGLSINEDGSKLYAVNSSGGNLIVLDLPSGTIEAAIPVGSNPLSTGSFLTNADCSNTPVTFTITVKSSITTPAIAATQATGNITACQGNASVYPGVENFKVSGINLQANITVAAPAGFEVSLNANSGYGGTVTLTQSGGNITDVMVYVRSSASAPAGRLSGNVTLNSTGAPTQIVGVAATVSPAPAITQPANQTINTGQSTAAVNFAGTANIFDWTNDTPSIGLAATGSGNIPSFTTGNTGSSSVIATIKVTPKTHPDLYVANTTDNSVSVIDITTNTVAKIQTDNYPYKITLLPDYSKAYVTCLASNMIDVINTANNTITKRIQVGDDNKGQGMAISPDGSKLYVVNTADNRITIINTATDAVINTINNLVNAPERIAVSPDGARLAVSEKQSDVAIINASDNSLIARVAVGPQPSDMVFNKEGNLLYVAAGAGSNAITIIRTSDNTVVKSLASQQQTSFLSSNDGSVIYATDPSSTTITTISTSANAIGGSINLNAGGYNEMAQSADGRYLYIAGGSGITVLDASSNFSRTSINTGLSGYGIAYKPGSACTGMPVTFTITVNANQNANFTASAVSGTISACQGTASARPKIEPFTIFGSNLTGNITATAPQYFEISLNPENGYTNSLTLPPTGGNVGNTVIYTRSSATAPVGKISNNITLASPGVQSQQVPVSATIDPLSTVTTPGPLTYNNGQNTTAINFTGTGNMFTWTNDSPSIGLATSGTGDIDSFKAINTSTAPVTATITVTPVTSGNVYAANILGNFVTGINGVTNKAVTPTIPVGDSPYDEAISPDGSTLYVSCLSSNDVYVINTATNSFITKIPVGQRPAGLVLSPNGSALYVVNIDGNSVSVINTATNTVSTTIHGIGTDPIRAAISPDGSKLYVSAQQSNDVTVINTATFAKIAVIPVGGFPQGLVTNADGSYLFVANQNSFNITVIRTSDNTMVNTLNFPGLNLMLSRDGTKIYASNTGSPNIGIISTATNALTGTINTGYTTGNSGMVESNDGKFLYVGNQNSNLVNVIDLTQNTMLAPINGVKEPYGMAYKDPDVCNGNPVTFTITVNPDNLAPTISATAATGNIFACEGTASASPAIEKFSVTGSSLQANVTVTAPAGFEVSLSPNNNYAGSLLLAQSGGALSKTTVYVRSSSSAPAGKLSGNVTLSSPGVPAQAVTVAAVINPYTTVANPGPFTYNNGENTTAINFTGTANSYSWTNDHTDIGLAASGTGNILVFTAMNAGTAPVVATITVTPKVRGYAYVTDQNSGLVSVVDVAANKVITDIETDSNPYETVLSADGSTVYVSCIGSNNIDVISTATNKVVKTISIGIPPSGITLSPDGSKLYVLSNQGNLIKIISTSTNTVINTISNIDMNPERILVSRDGSKLFVTDISSDYLDVISTATNSVINKIQVGNYPLGIASGIDGNTLYVADSNNGLISVIDVAAGTVKKTISVFGVTNLLMSNDGATLYASSPASAVITMVNTSSGAVTGVITINNNNGCAEMAESADGKYLYAANQVGNSLEIIDLATSKDVSSVTVGMAPYGVACSTATNCDGNPVSFTITVNPSVITTGNFSTSRVTGTIQACEGTASVTPHIQTFFVSATDLQSDVKVIAPGGFEVSLSSNSGYGGSVVIPMGTGVLSQVQVFVRSAAFDHAGQISGSVMLNATSKSGMILFGVQVSGLISPLPDVISPGNQVVANGAATTDVNFTGSANTFTWTNDKPIIGLAASGIGDIPSFTAMNTGTTPVTATITVTPKNSRYIYIADSHNQSITVYDPATIALMGHIAVGAAPEGVSVTPDGKYVYVANFNDNTVSVINTSNNSVIKTIPVGTNCYGIQASADSKYVYVANYGSNTVSVIDVASNTVSATITVGSGPEDLVLSPDGAKLYVTNYFANTVSVIDVATNKVTGTLACGVNPYGIAVSPDGGFIYVTQINSASVSVINVASNTIVATVPVGQNPEAIITNADGSLVYVANENANTISVINTSTNMVSSTFNAGKNPVGLQLSADGGILYVQSFQSGNLVQINTANTQQVNVIGVGAGADSFGNFLAPGMGCPGNSITFTITVNPNEAPPTITAGSMTGSIIACNGSPSTGIGQVSVSGKNLTGNITATAPAGFEVSLDPASGYGGNVVIIRSGGNVSTVPVYIRSAATAPTGKIFGYLTLSSTDAASVSVAVTGLVNIVPNAMPYPMAQEVMAGASTGEIDFNGPGDIFTWTNDNTDIGLADKGTGNIAAFTAINNGSSDVTATITVTPEQVSYAYIASAPDHTISVINTLTNAVVAKIYDPQNSFGVGITPDAKEVIFMASQQNEGAFNIIDPSSNTLTSGLAWQNDVDFRGAAISPDGQKIYMAARNKGVVYTVSTDLKHLNIFQTYTTGGQPFAPTVSPDGSTLYVTNSSENIISVIDVASANVSTINIPSQAYQTCISPDGTLLYISIPGDNSVEVYNLSAKAVIATIAVDSKPEGICISPDGTTVYVTNNGSSSVSVISTLTNKVAATVNVGVSPVAINTTSDGQYIYVINQGSNTVSVIKASNNTVTNTINVGSSPSVLGNFILPGSACPGQPSTVTITVHPKIVPAITAGNASGSIVACEGSPSADPYIKLITVSGKNLKSDITAAAPAGFEVSINPTVGYNANATLAQSNGTINDAVVYVRSATSAPAGIMSGDIVFSSNSAATVNVPVSATIDPPASADKVNDQTVTNGDITAAINFTGTANTFNWTNDNISIGLPASGTGNIAPFTAINNTNSPVKAKVNVVPIPSISGYAYVANSNSNNVSVINLQTNKVIATVTVGKTPNCLAVSPDGGRVYVANYDDGTLSVIDASKNNVEKVITVGSTPYGIAVSPDGGVVYVTSESSQYVTAVNTVDYTTTNIPVDGVPTNVLVSPDGKLLYVTGFNRNQIYVFDRAANTLKATIPTIGAPFSLDISPDGSRLYYVNTNALCIVSASSNTVTETIPVGQNPVAIAADPGGGIVYVTNNASNTVSVVDVTSDSVTGTINIGHNPGGISITPDGNTLYATNESDGTVSVIDIKTLAVSTTVKVGAGPVSIGKFIAANTMKCEGVPVTFTVTVEPSSNNIVTQNIFIPNTFTPNGDGINDNWVIKSLENYPNCTVAIYNRWGEKLYSSIGYPIPWDGTYKGANLPVGTYYYIINLKTGVNPISGWVAIVK